MTCYKIHKEENEVLPKVSINTQIHTNVKLHYKAVIICIYENNACLKFSYKTGDYTTSLGKQTTGHPSTL